MPDRIEVQGIPKRGLSAGRDSIEVPTENEQMITALHVERDGYQLRLDRGETQYGGEDISVIVGKINEQIVHYGGRVDHADFMSHTVAPDRIADVAEVTPQIDVDEKVTPSRRLARGRISE